MISFKIVLSLIVIMLMADGIIAQSENGLMAKSTSTKMPVKYPIMGSNPFPLINGKDLGITAAALEMARALTIQCGCDKALQEHGVASLNDLFNMEINGNIFDGRSSTLGLPYIGEQGRRETVMSNFSKNRERIIALVVASHFTGKGNVIFLNNYFFNPKSFPVMAVEQRALILIHEMVHQFGNKSDADFGGSIKLTKILTDQCLPSLNEKMHLKP